MAIDLTLYESKTASASLVTEKTGLAPTDLAQLLELSAGTLAGVTVYRPYYVAARLIATQRNKLMEAEGVTFEDPQKVVRELLSLQRAIDVGLGLTIATGLEATMAALLALGLIAPGSGRVDVIGTW